jgi:hypothetical protein
MAIMSKELAPAAAVSVRLGLTREAVIRRIQRGEIGGVLLGGRWLANLADVQRLEKARIAR